MLSFAIEAAKLAALAAIKPLFMALIQSLLNPKFLLKSFLEVAELVVKETSNDFDNRQLEELKKLLGPALDKELEKK